jgi:hypothetical protein
MKAWQFFADFSNKGRFGSVSFSGRHKKKEA